VGGRYCTRAVEPYGTVASDGKAGRFKLKFFLMMGLQASKIKMIKQNGKMQRMVEESPGGL
jgi:hypothetical protein